METISTLANTASRAIWGEPSKEEPLSGVNGDVSKGEPYDAGNIEHIEHQNEPVPDAHAIKHEDSAITGDANPAKVKDSSLSTQDHTQSHTDTRDPSDPKTNPESQDAKIKENVDNSAGTDDNDNPVKIDGPGPEPIADVAKRYGGDAGNAPSSDRVDKDGSSDISKTQKQQQQPEEEEDGPQKVSHGEGTGEKYVKSSGLKVDGGDFDAAAPGAGREADRLLEEKGLHREESGMNSTSTDSVDSKGSGGSGKGKVSLKEKIKAKLHRS